MNDRGGFLTISVTFKGGDKGYTAQKLDFPQEKTPKIIAIMTTILTESTIETIAGGFAGFCQVLVGHPFDTIKVKFEKQRKVRF